MRSLQRACEIFCDPIINDTEAGHEVYFRLTEKLEPRIAKTASTYIRRYCSKRGWTMTELTHKKLYLRFLIKPAAPKPHRARQRTPERIP